MKGIPLQTLMMAMNLELAFQLGEGPNDEPYARVVLTIPFPPYGVFVHEGEWQRLQAAP